MKYLIFIGLFAAGGIAGYFLGVNQDSQPENEISVEPEMITEFVYDTIVQKEMVEVPVYESQIDTAVMLVDTLIKEDFNLDTLSESIIPKDSVKDEEELSIRRDELIASARIPIEYLETEEEKDSLIKEMLGIKESLPTEMTVQFWSSPISYSGYKLSKNTLVLYGLSEQFEYVIYRKSGNYYLSNGEVFYLIKETSDFLPLQVVEKTRVIND